MPANRFLFQRQVLLDKLLYYNSSNFKLIEGIKDLLIKQLETCDVVKLRIYS